MIVRVESQPGRSLISATSNRQGGSKIRHQKMTIIRGWVIISGLTALFIGWLVYHGLVEPNWLHALPAAIQEVLGLVEAAGAFTLGFLWFSLLWRRLRPTKQLEAIELEALLAMDPATFERFVAQLFRRKGYNVKIRGQKGDLGVDLELVQPSGKRAIVQCKRYQNAIDPKIVRELFGTLVHEQVSHAFLVTTAKISDAARKWADQKPITLIDGETLVDIISALAEKPLINQNRNPK